MSVSKSPSSFNLGMGGAQRVFHSHSVELAKYDAVTEAVFNMEGGNIYASDNEMLSLEVVGMEPSRESLQLLAKTLVFRLEPSGRNMQQHITTG